MPRLKTVTRDDLTIVRRRQGKGYGYLDADGQRISEPGFLARARHLGIPPAWKEVRLALSPRAHIQCCGVDDAGRVQYIYHPDWEAKRDARKLRRLGALTQALPRIRRRVQKDLEAEAGSQELALAIAVALIDRTAMRLGREKYLEERGTRGAGTLFTRDVRVEGDDVHLTFPSKSGKTAEYVVNDARLAAAVARIKMLPGKRLLVYRNGEGKLQPIRTPAINAYLQSVGEADISAKDFRTLHASALAGDALAQLEPAASEAGRKRQIAAVAKEVSEFLQNTPMISRKSYIVPALFHLFEKGLLKAVWAKRYALGGLRQREQRLRAALAAAG